MGTMHVSDKSAFSFVETAISLMQTCTWYYGEMDMRSVDHNVLLKAFSLPEDKQYAAVLGKRKYDKISKVLKKSFDIDLNTYNHLAPMYFQTMMAAKILNQDYPVSLDQYLLQKAMELDLSISGLESVEEQCAIASKLDIDIQFKHLLDICRNTASYKQKLKYYSTLYANGQWRQLYCSSSKTLGIFKKTLLYERNAIMSERISNIISKDSAFITVGAGHLGGNSGISALLKKQNIKVIPLTKSH